MKYSEELIKGDVPNKIKVRTMVNMDKYNMTLADSFEEAVKELAKEGTELFNAWYYNDFRKFIPSVYMSKYMDLEKYPLKYNENLHMYRNSTEINYYSNSCGEFFNKGKELELEELPKKLQEAFTNLYEENKFGLNCYLVKFKGTYGISLSAGYDECYAKDLGITFFRLNEIAREKAKELAGRYKEYPVVYGEKAVAWSDGKCDTIVDIIVPWNISKEMYEEIGNWFSAMCYDIKVD